MLHASPVDLIEEAWIFSRLSVVISKVVITALTVMITSFDRRAERLLQLKIVSFVAWSQQWWSSRTNDWCCTSRPGGSRCGSNSPSHRYRRVHSIRHS